MMIGNYFLRNVTSQEHAPSSRHVFLNTFKIQSIRRRNLVEN